LRGLRAEGVAGRGNLRNIKERVMDWFTVAGIALLLAVALVMILWR